MTDVAPPVPPAPAADDLTPAPTGPALTLGGRALLASLLGALSVTLLLTQLGVLGGALQVALTLPLLLLTPGLALVSAWRLAARHPAETLIMAVTLSLLTVMLSLLTTNTLLPLLGIARPLDAAPVTWTVWSVCALLTLGAWRTATWQLTVRPRVNAAGAGVVGLAVLTLLLSVLGPTALNNGQPGTLTLAALCLGGATLLGTLLRRGHLSVSAALYLVGLALLLMTSLRGWYTTGHDVQRELRVFQLTAESGLWDISRYRDSYNACLSITLLPTAFRHLLDLPDPYVFKVAFQVIFALVPLGTYLLSRRFMGRAASALAFIYFVSFPTYFGDMPMLNRQEIGFLMLTGMLLILTNDRVPLARRQWVATLLGAGLVISHYSTTYATLLALLLTAAFMLVRRRGRRALVTPWMVAALLATNFLWVNVVTHTASGITSLLFDTLETVTGQRRGAEQSSDVSYSIFLAKAFDPQASLDEYDRDVAQTLRRRAPGDYFYSDAQLGGFHPVAAPERTLPLTRAGQALKARGVDVLTLNTVIRQGIAKVLQLLILIGLAAFLIRHVRRREPTRLSPDLFAFAVSTLGFVMLIVLLPFLSVEYGLLRAFQQALLLLAPFVVLGTHSLLGWAPPAARQTGSVVIALGFYLSMTGVVPQALGQYYPQLHLNNAGKYYDIYYVHPSEVLGVQWLTTYLRDARVQNADVQTEVQTDRYAINRLQPFFQFSSQDDLYPALLRRSSFVFLGFTHVRRSEATVLHKGDLITYTYPMPFLDREKDLIYSNGYARVYR